MSDTLIPSDQIVSARWRAESAAWEAKMRDEREQAAAEIQRMREALAEARAALMRISTREIENTRRNPDWPRRVARNALPSIDALLSRLEGEGKP